jgi:ABC-type uncharacterized transport system substrate-binding protein
MLWLKIFLILTLALSLSPRPLSAETAEGPAAGSPAGPPKKWRVIYVEGGQYRDYYKILFGFILGLKSLELIDYQAPPPLADEDSMDSAELWRWLTENARSERLEFLTDGYYSAGWNQEERVRLKGEILRRLRADRDVDLILTFGTWAGLDLVTDEHRVPVMSITATDPVAAGISKAENDSGLDHAHVQVERDRNERQIRIFHDIFKFRRLGVPIDDTPDGQGAMGLPTIRKMAQELGFELVPCETSLEIDDPEKSFRNLLACVRDLSVNSDAIYLTVNNGMQAYRLEEILEPIIKARIPSFSQSGPNEAKLGVLMSIGRDNFEDASLFEAKVVEAIISGQTPRRINQVYEAPLTLALNLKMTLAIGWNPPFEVLIAMDQMYQTIGRRP